MVAAGESGIAVSRTVQRAGDGVRTHDNDVGNVVLYQLSYTRLSGTKRVCSVAPGESRNYRSPAAAFKGN